MLLLLELWARVGRRGVERRKMRMKRGRWGVRMGIFLFVLLGLGGFLGDDDYDVCGNVGVGGIAYEVERMCAGCFSLFMF